MVFINHEAGTESLLLLHVLGSWLGRAIGIQVICGTTQAASGTGTKLNGHIFLQYDEPAEEFNFNNRIWFSVLEKNFGDQPVLRNTINPIIWNWQPIRRCHDPKSKIRDR